MKGRKKMSETSEGSNIEIAAGREGAFDPDGVEAVSVLRAQIGDDDPDADAAEFEALLADVAELRDDETVVEHMSLDEFRERIGS